MRHAVQGIVLGKRIAASVVWLQNSPERFFTLQHFLAFYMKFTTLPDFTILKFLQSLKIPLQSIHYLISPECLNCNTLSPYNAIYAERVFASLAFLARAASACAPRLASSSSTRGAARTQLCKDLFYQAKRDFRRLLLHQSGGARRPSCMQEATLPTRSDWHGLFVYADEIHVPLVLLSRHCASVWRAQCRRREGSR